MNYSFEYTLATHCSPTLAGLKPASLISLTNEEYVDWIQSVERFNKNFKQQGFQIEVVCLCENRMLLLLYHQEMLSDWLGQNEVKELLASIGYPTEGPLLDMIYYMARRFHELKEFPHEIGAILGYPIVDVLGFIHNKGKNFKLCGYWKVYGDVESSEKVFRQYRVCKDVFCEAISNGFTIEELLKAA